MTLLAISTEDAERLTEAFASTTPPSGPPSQPPPPTDPACRERYEALMRDRKSVV